MIHLTRRQSIVLACTLIALFFVAVYLLSRREQQSRTNLQLAEAKATPTPTPLPQQTGDKSAQFFLNDFNRSEIRNGRKVWEIKAERGQYYPDKMMAEITNADVWLFRDNGEEVYLKAPQAQLGINGTELNKAFFPGTVHVVYNKDLTVDTSVATYDKAADTIVSDHPVTIDSELLHIEGNKFNATISQSSIVISGGVKTVIKPKQKKGK